MTQEDLHDTSLTPKMQSIDTQTFRQASIQSNEAQLDKLQKAED